MRAYILLLSDLRLILSDIVEARLKLSLELSLENAHSYQITVYEYKKLTELLLLMSYLLLLFKCLCTTFNVQIDNKYKY